MSTYTRGEAAGLLAIALGAPLARDWLAGWSHHEIQCGIGCSHPQNNLWASGQHAPGSTTWNPPHHVQNYPTLAEGIAATAVNLNDPKYPAYQRMLHDLQQGIWDSGNIRAGLSTWCGDACYSADAANFPAEGRQHGNDQFDDSGGGSGGKGPVLQSPAQSCVFGVPGQCPTDQTCWPIGPSGMPLCDTTATSIIGPARCFSGPLANLFTSCDDGTGKILNGTMGATPGTPGLFSIAGWDSNRITKWVLGAALIIVGIVLIGSILLEKTAPIVQPVVDAAGKVAAVAA